MYSSVKQINLFFKSATKENVDSILEQIILSDRQKTIFEMFYLRKKDIGYIADTLNVCRVVIDKELKAIREKIISTKSIQKE